MNKRMYWIFSVLLVAGLMLAACQPAATEAPAEVEQPAEEPVAEEPAAEEPAAEEPAAEEPVAEEPTEEEGPAPGQEGKWCSGTDIVFFPGGSPGGPFATVVYNGALAAEADLGPNVE
jgi:hypothetical protein